MKGLLVSLHITGKPPKCLVERNELTNIRSETCTLVETMYSLGYLYQAVGDNDFADKCERTAFNALPVQLTPDWWARQYGKKTHI